MSSDEPWEIYLDETHVGKPHKKMGFGGIAVAESLARKLETQLTNWRSRTGMHKEMKWQRVSSLKKKEYRTFSRCLTYNAGEKLVCFQVIMVDRHECDYRSYHENDKDLAWDKLYYQLVIHRFIPQIPENARIVIFPDQRQRSKKSVATLGEFKDAINAGIAKKFQGPRNKVVSIEPSCSKKVQLLQLVDIGIGAVAFQNNDGHLKPKPNPASVEIANSIAADVGLHSLKTSTPRSFTHFGIWQFRFNQPHRNKKSVPSPTPPKWSA